MTYSPLTPSPASSPNSSVVSIQTNYATYATGFSQNIAGVIYNHYPLNANFQGKHAAVLFDQQANDPSIGGTLVSLYAKNTVSASTPAGQPQLYARVNTFLPNGGTNAPMQLTFNTVNTAGPTQYQSFLVGGYLLFFGNIPAPSPGPIVTPVVITLTPTPTKILAVFVEPQNIVVANSQPKFAGAVINTPNTFTITPAATYVNTDVILWMAIAKA